VLFYLTAMALPGERTVRFADDIYGHDATLHRTLEKRMRISERSLERRLKRTTRTVNALRTVLLPAVDADVPAVASGLEEEDRRKAMRWRAGRS
jgi:ATP synthase subunit D